MSMSRSVLRHMVLAMVMSVVALGATAAENDHNQTVRNISEESGFPPERNTYRKR